MRYVISLIMLLPVFVSVVLGFIFNSLWIGFTDGSIYAKDFWLNKIAKP